MKMKMPGEVIWTIDYWIVAKLEMASQSQYKILSFLVVSRSKLVNLH
jgi:hypothetical protein